MTARTRPLPLLLLGALTALGCGARCAPSRQGAPAGGPAAGTGPPAPAAAPGPARWLKGALHAHSNASGDSRTPAADVARWYAEHGFDFVVLTDHNRFAALPAGPPLMILGVELTAELPTCEPPSDATRCPLHVGAWFVNPARRDEAPPRPDSVRRVDVYGWWLDVARVLEGVAVIHHPNYEYGADAEVLAALARRGARFVEIANQSHDSNNAGDATHPSVEALWDAVLSRGLTMYGVASDDAHHYYDAAAVADGGEEPFTGDRGFVVVRAALDPAAIRAALERGDFHASTGVRLERVDVRGGALEVEVAAATPGDCVIECIGPGGRVVSRATGRAGRCPPPVAGGYVRAVVTDAAGRRAWTQPVRAP
jgi:hypothetical protein